MSRTIELDQAASDKTLAIAVTDQIHISLAETRTGGFHWQVISPSSAIYGVRDNGLQPAPGVGGTGTHRWTLTALQPGTAVFELTYGRSWVPATAASRFKLTLEVSS